MRIIFNVKHRYDIRLKFLNISNEASGKQVFFCHKFSAFVIAVII